MTDHGAHDPLGPKEADRILAPLVGARGLLLAVSGGADSVALMGLVARWSRAPARPPVHVASVDHGARSGARADALAVLRQAATLGLTAEVVDLPAGVSPTQRAWRDARREVLAACAERVAASHVVTGHHRDDQAETVLMRLARGSGVRGLAGMRGLARQGRIVWARPLLEIAGSRLRATCRNLNLTWHDDPSNRDPAFERARWREAAPTLHALGLTPSRLAGFASSMREADAALEAYAGAILAAASVHPNGLIALPLAALRGPPPVQRGALRAALAAASGTGCRQGCYGPSEPALDRLLALIGDQLEGPDGPQGRRTLSGAVVTVSRAHGAFLTVHREAGRANLPRHALPPGARAVFDERYEIRAGSVPVVVSALGAGVPDTPPPAGVTRRAWREAWRTAPGWWPLDGSKEVRAFPPRSICEPTHGGPWVERDHPAERIAAPVARARAFGLVAGDG